MNIKLQQKQALPEQRDLDKGGHWLMIFARPLKKGAFPYAEALLRRRAQAGLKKPANRALSLDLPNAAASHIAFAVLEPDTSAFELLTLARKLMADQARLNPAELRLVVTAASEREAERLAEALISAALASAAPMPGFKSKPPVPARLKKIVLYGVAPRHGFKQSFAMARGNALSRYLSALPPNRLTPTEYLKRLRPIAAENNWQLEFYDEAALKKKKAGAFLAVAQGSPRRDAGIVRLRYTPPKAAGKKLCLIGKGICYDTGGTNLKPANYMFGMHEDMQGSAVALGALLALSQLDFRRPVECWLALAMNHIGPNAYKPNDVVTATDGSTIEVVHTDAEGRMILADTLALAAREKPALIMDFATLTGACIYALGTAYSGVFTNKKNWRAGLIQAGEDCGERVWPFPLDKDFDALLESEVADIKQCSRENGVDHILAARFLQRFVKRDTPWIHMDLSSSNRKGGLAHIPTDTTGFGVRYAVHLLMNGYLDE